MAPSKRSQSSTSTPSSSSSSKPPSSTTKPPSSYSSPSHSQSQSPRAILLHLWHTYLSTTPQRTKLIDVFMAFLVVVGALQFVYCVLAGNYPFNAFLAGFSATVGQFVLTASLRIQSNPDNKAEFRSVSQER
ncbi:hypothetical protein MMC20_004272 [Loxospora ochrophaea]|nr:hypothetical protein [Loxospora ochrophaea]